MARGALCLGVLIALGGCATPRRPAEAPPKPRPIRPPAPAETEKSIQRGVGFLLASQSKDGSWGSARRTKGLNIYAPVPSAHQAFRAAVTALCVSALIETGDPRPEVAQALARAESWLETNLPRVRRADQSALYNCWTHAYGIQALVRLAAREPAGSERRKRLLGLVQEQVGLLQRYESVNGGWGYYDFGAHTQRPDTHPTSFTTATCLVALHEARGVGAAVPDRLIERAMATMRRQRNPDFTYHYSENFFWRPLAAINRPAGSLGRSQAANYACRLWGDEAVTDDVLRTWLDRLFARNDWLDMGRKRPVPHEAWFAIAGYFYYYGHYYAALCIEELSPAERPRFRAYMAHTLLRLQEKDGSWWDFPFYDYHQPYGTAFALMSLARSRPSQP